MMTKQAVCTVQGVIQEAERNMQQPTSQANTSQAIKSSGARFLRQNILTKVVTSIEMKIVMKFPLLRTRRKLVVGACLKIIIESQYVQFSL